MGRPRIPMIVPTTDDLPPKEINFDQVLYWLDLQCSADEIAGSFRVSVDTLYRRIKEKYGLTFAELKEKCSGACKISLRHNQLKLTSSSAAMAIWLGKIWLGQKDPDKQQDVFITKDALHDFMNKTRNPVANVKKDDIVGMAGAPEIPGM